MQALFQIRDSSTEAKPLTQLDKAAGENSHRSPVFLLPDRRFLYFSRTDDLEKRGIYLESLDRKQPRRRILIADGQFALGRDPDSKTYYLLSQQGGKIAAQNFDLDRGELTGTSRILLDRAGTISRIRHRRARDTERICAKHYASYGSIAQATSSETLGTPADYWSVNLSLQRSLRVARQKPQLPKRPIQTLDRLPCPMAYSNHSPTRSPQRPHLVPR